MIHSFRFHKSNISTSFRSHSSFYTFKTRINPNLSYQQPIRKISLHSTPSRKPSWILTSSIGLLIAGWAFDKYYYAEAVARTLRLVYNASVIILDYKINFNPQNDSTALHARVSNRMARTCTKNAGLYIKLGQSLAIQAAVLPPPYKVAFESMFDASEPISLQDVQDVWNHEFSEPIEDVFDEFSHSPIACGSIGQVHKAKLKSTGESVAVKIQRPAIPIQLEFDLFAYKSLLYVCEKSFGIPIYFVAKYVADQMRHETDFVREAKNSERTAKCFESDPTLKNRILVPKVNWDLTTKRVLTTEFIEGGCRLTEEDKFKKDTIDKKSVMDLAMKMFSSMLFKFGWLHCDLHPGNVLVVKRDGKMKLALIDHGLYIQLPDKFRAEYCELWRSIFVLDTGSIQRIASGWGIANSELFVLASWLPAHDLLVTNCPFKSGKKSGSLKEGTPANAPLTSYEKDLKIKDTLVGMLENQKMIPNELIFIIRCMRMMQGNNQVLGSPSNRINILAHGAASGMNAYKVLSYSDGSFKEVTKDWIKHLARVWTFQITLVFVDLGFLLTRIRQWWLRDVRGKRKREGFEDLLQRKIEILAKEEFGITLDDKAFMG
ncbi:uncharacterized protein MELLADRAFT_94662 [Melampsora larici-populina 98AG31]|uniref:Protein kinase domain-containing protein n=1 Tax=Melampsora larici-populina (strain 98AG31 / pathotype 3-4-7) TaxID=747676 RepID=F4S7H7_MELLP|nr:uncharacterized protein MELLADRAFT_94662 [Melampsora larici-populina 98AG31]EGF99410.1 hypothetical protein MELLADRAFT_94662 [Melampsora larici-populina 98AG31]